jgi:nucleoside-diphosphate-sugar epimerase
MKVLITGGTGFIGSRLALRCLESGYKVNVIGQINTPAEEYNKQFIESKGAKICLTPMSDTNTLNKLVDDNIDYIFHLAAAQHEMNIPDQRFWDVNVEGTRNILNAAVDSGVKRFVHGSTIGVYGILNGAIDEGSPCKPDNIYGVTKLAGEKLVLSYIEKLPVSVIRIPETYGPGDRRLLKLFKAIKKQVFFKIGNGRNLHSLIYIDDLIEGLLLAATCESSVGKVFLLSGKEAISTNDMIEIVSRNLDKKPPRIRLPLAPVWAAATITEGILRPLKIQPPIHRRRIDFFKKSFTLSHQKAKEIMGFTPKVSFNEGSLNTAKWYAENGLL